MNTYRSTLPLRVCAASRTHAGSVVGLSMATSHCRFFSASNRPFRSPINCSTSFGNSPGCVLPRLNVVTLCPRLSAYRTWYGPVNPVPPRMRMRRGFTDFSANSVADLVPKASAPPVAAESLINWRRVLCIIGDIALVGRLCQTPLAFHRNALQFKYDTTRSHALDWGQRSWIALAG